MFNNKKSGQKRIDDAINVFRSVSEELQHGIKMCEAEECAINEKINHLSEKKSSIIKSRVQANIVVENISKMLG